MAAERMHCPEATKLFEEAATAEGLQAIKDKVAARGVDLQAVLK
jgi:hypothetical protein